MLFSQLHDLILEENTWKAQSVKLSIKSQTIFLLKSFWSFFGQIVMSTIYINPLTLYTPLKLFDTLLGTDCHSYLDTFQNKSKKLWREKMVVLLKISLTVMGVSEFTWSTLEELIFLSITLVFLPLLGFQC